MCRHRNRFAVKDCDESNAAGRRLRNRVWGEPGRFLRAIDMQSVTCRWDRERLTVFLSVVRMERGTAGARGAKRETKPTRKARFASPLGTSGAER
ncbi:hypothetical protein Sfum_3673 [Syntrophobacter fumaroxidans MPOB]|uniref:Uncharacterized protein n=1 Tax=Syntrophobacter fumaroxidans (strain DSM 10017 / MPOB) TaxID=335543 RepID=A0LPJ1_SYNFM|nr:hypothetical protein Sfum_3673 [Syntrophobacter fumaroxidans MPOB]